MAPIRRHRLSNLISRPTSAKPLPANVVPTATDQEFGEAAEPVAKRVKIRRIKFPECPAWASQPLHQGSKAPLAVSLAMADHPGPIIFSWSHLGSVWPPTNFPNAISWIEGPNQNWIACDRPTGRILKNIHPFPEDNFLKYYIPSPPPPATVWRPEGYPLDTDPFRSFLEAGLVPIDRDPDVIWGVTKSKLFRACRISTGKADDKVVPDLIVLGHSGMTIREYEACVKKLLLLGCLVSLLLGLFGRME
ncbi:MAG: hypothetical protein L6R39_004725 [Caloplaca ligustica]|nr:MAG: hypothetical protein L6R39_004725 [Caloplaca ligustica]